MRGAVIVPVLVPDRRTGVFAMVLTNDLAQIWNLPNQLLAGFLVRVIRLSGLYAEYLCQPVNVLFLWESEFLDFVGGRCVDGIFEVFRLGSARLTLSDFTGRSLVGIEGGVTLAKAWIVGRIIRV